jgi:hypothetical protein
MKKSYHSLGDTSKAFMGETKDLLELLIDFLRNGWRGF